LHPLLPNLPLLPSCVSCHPQAGTGYAEIWLQRPDWWEGSWGYEEGGFEEEQQRKVA